MVAVIFEGIPKDGQKDEYLDIAANLRPLLDGIDGFVSIERFMSISNPSKILSLSFWRDDESVERWRNLRPHRAAQVRGRDAIFADYHLRVAHVFRDYGMEERSAAPEDSRRFHGEIPTADVVES